MLEPLTGERTAWKPAPERWSVSEALAHWLDVERRNLCHRAQLIVNEGGRTCNDHDQNAEYAKGTYSGRNDREVLGEFCRKREVSVAWLESLPPETWRRTTRYHEVDGIRLSTIINLWLFHDLGHIRQITELVRAHLCWDGMGPLQHYYSVDP